MFEIAICDDEMVDLSNAERLLFQYANEHGEYKMNINTFFSPIEMLYHISEKGGFDFLILDVYMIGMLGTEVAQELRRLGDRVEIIFVTSSKVHAIEAFEVDAAKYLVKPYSDKDFFVAVDKVMNRIAVNLSKTFTIKTAEGIVKIATHEVVFTETSKNNYQTIYRIKGSPLLTRMTAGELFERLAIDKSFVRCGVSFNINLKYIRQISKDSVIFDTYESLHIPYRAYAQLKADFLSYQLGDTE